MDIANSASPTNGGGTETTATATLPRRRPRANSEEVAELHNHLVDFLNNSSSSDNHKSLDGSLFGVNLRRVGSGRRSFRGTLTSNAQTISEDSRERSILNIAEENKNDSHLRKQDDVDDKPLDTSSFNRFSRFRRTFSCRSKKGEIVQGEKSNSNMNLSSSEKEAQSEGTGSVEVTVPTMPTLSNLKQQPSPYKYQYYQQLTAIISPTKIVTSNDEIHQSFGQQANSLHVPDRNIIVSTVTKERVPSTGPLPPLQHRSSSLNNRSATSINAAIVAPLQKDDLTSSAKENSRKIVLAPLKDITVTNKPLWPATSVVTAKKNTSSCLTRSPQMSTNVGRTGSLASSEMRDLKRSQATTTDLSLEEPSQELTNQRPATRRISSKRTHSTEPTSLPPSTIVTPTRL